MSRTTLSKKQLPHFRPDLSRGLTPRQVRQSAVGASNEALRRVGVVTPTDAHTVFNMMAELLAGGRRHR